MLRCQRHEVCSSTRSVGFKGGKLRAAASTMARALLRRARHEVYSSTRLDLGLPKRILDISASNEIVVLRKTKAEKVQYATLSYCWGDGVPLRTTQSTIKQHYAGIPLASFPATLKDAIVFAKGLGFQYIWIDALCIIQDDSRDWEEQSAAMTAIYHGCSLNIAIADAPNCNSGIAQGLKDGDAHKTLDSNSQSNAWLNHRSRKLETRGWVFQETLVSVASVYITDDGLVWDCCSEVCAQGDSPRPARQWSHPNDQMTPKATWADQTPISRLDSASSKNLDVLRIWYEWLILFSYRDLSNVNDKLPAMAGLASRVQSASSATYAAGLWEEDIHLGLIWSAQESEGLTRPGNGAPSWSWASVEGRLDYLWCLSVYCVYPGVVHVEEWLDLKVLAVSVNEVHPGTFGRVTGGRIEAIGTLQRGTIESDEDRGGFGEGRVGFNFHLEGSGLEYSLDEPQSRGEIPRPCWLLRIASVLPTRCRSMKRDGPFISFLIVEETGTQKDEFRRIGKAFCDASSIFRKDITVATDLFQDGQRKRITLV